MNTPDTTTVISTYLEKVKQKFYSGDATEHSYRSALEALIEGICPDITALNERKRVSVGAPDLVLSKKRADPQQTELIKSVPLGFVEAKDIQRGILDKQDNIEQLERYLDLGNVIHTDGLEFRFYFEKKLVKTIHIATLNDANHIVAQGAGYEDFVYFLRQTISQSGRTIRTAKTLALLMADRARPIRSTIFNALTQDIEAEEHTTLRNQFDAFRETLIHDMSAKSFADIYAETIAYGLFAARYNDDTPETFTLSEAAEKIPQTNPFLRQFFLQIAAYEKDTRLDWVLHNFAELFSYADVHKIMENYGKDTGMNHDPVTHFYETFLGEYDQKRRKARGVYYTPLPIVQYIVRAVDDVLKQDFGLADGLADDSTIKHVFNVDPYKKGQGTGKTEYFTREKNIPRVQILDPATGTSTFLNETIKHIYAAKGERLGSSWSNYVEENLLPRIHGFEILMAAYSMAHMRLGLTLEETGYKPSAKHPRLGVYLTNSLEEAAKDEPPLLGMLGMTRAITEEAIEADKVKRDLPIMVVMGNPPYSVSSSNKSKYIEDLMKEYKKDLNERNIQPLSDDYIKFIRYAENMIEKTGQGVVAMITNNSFIDGLIHRQMRKHLLETFDKIYVLDLHGNSKKQETAPDGGKDENIFDIQQGVSIVLMIKNGRKQSDDLGEVYFSELYGRRNEKYSKLGESISFKKVSVEKTNIFFKQFNSNGYERYLEYISLDQLFVVHNAGSATGKDSSLVSFNEDSLNQSLATENIIYDEKSVQHYNYRPFDRRFTVYDNNIFQRLRLNVMKHVNVSGNKTLLATQRNRQLSTLYISVVDGLVDRHYLDSAADSMHAFPLYLYDQGARTPNFNPAELSALTRSLTYEPTPENILDYIYGTLHSPSYREKYKEFLKLDFPRVPIPANDKKFQHFVEAGAKLSELHLMHGVIPGNYAFSGEGDSVVTKLRYEDGNVWINDAQYFADVPENAWNFYIGGYQPAQKWLKDRKGRALGYKDIEHYQKIVTILIETYEIMNTIDTHN